jgi:tripartite-type tricarboxylate transporter receptor subunit TctC
MIGTDAVAKSPADGYTVLLTNGAPIVLNPAIYTKMAYATQDLVPIARVSQVPMVLLVNSSVPVTSVKELVAWAKQSKQQITFASFGVGSESHLAGEYFSKVENLGLTHVAYKGAAPALQDLAGGQVTVMFADPGSSKGMIATGRVKVLAACGPERLRSLPNVPTFVELGYPGMADFVSWFGVFAPAATPKPIVQKLAAAIVKAVESPDVAARLRELDQEPSPMLSDVTAQFVAANTASWAKLVRDIGGVKID